MPLKKAKNLEEHLEIYYYYLEKPSPKRLKEELVKGFERFDDVEDYGFALRYFEESQGSGRRWKICISVKLCFG